MTVNERWVSEEFRNTSPGNSAAQPRLNRTVRLEVLVALIGHHLFIILHYMNASLTWRRRIYARQQPRGVGTYAKRQC